MTSIALQHIEKFSAPDWGAYYTSSPNDAEKETGLRIVLFGSTLGGMWVLESLKQLKALLGERITLVGLATDDARDSRARISIKKRIWHYFEKTDRDKMVEQIIQNGLSVGMEVFTGNIKSTYFDELLKLWNPDLIIMACFGQIVPRGIFTYPAKGMYNFHPSDLKNDIGAGPRPFEETLACQLKYTCVSLMGVTEIIDHGPMIGQSPTIRITGVNDECVDNVLLAEEKVTSVFPHMAWVLVNKILSFGEAAVPGNFQIDFDLEIDEAVKARLKQPLAGVHSTAYPYPDLRLFNSPQKMQQI